MRKDVREFIRRLEAVGLTVESTPGHYRVLRDGKPLRKANGVPFMLPFSPTRPGGGAPRLSSSGNSASTSSRAHGFVSRPHPMRVQASAGLHRRTVGNSYRT